MKKVLLGLLLAASFASATFADSMVPDMPAQPTVKYYKLDKKAFINYYSGKQASLQVTNCPKDTLLQLAGLSSATRKWTNAAYEDETRNLTYSFDFVNCNMSAYQTSYDQNMTPKTLSMNDALATAKAFLATLPIYSSVSSMLGEPVVIGAYGNNGPMPYRDYASAKEQAAAEASGNYIDADMYTNYSIVFPYKIDGKEVYYQYGSRMGITMEVGGNGVSSFNAPVLFPSGDMKNARRMSNSQMLAYINRGGNNQYWGNKSTISLGKPKSIYLYVQDWRNGKTTNYIASATLLTSSIFQDSYNPYSLYEMVVADYVFANPGLNQYIR